MLGFLEECFSYLEDGFQLGQVMTRIENWKIFFIDEDGTYSYLFHIHS